MVENYLQHADHFARILNIQETSKFQDENNVIKQDFKKDVEQINSDKDNNSLNLILAINYSGRWDIQNAVKRILSSKKNNILKNFNEKDFEKYLSTSNIPDPELLIRTSGEQRISNFYLWQTAYTELYFTDILWPDFNKKELNNAIFEFNKRNRRFGKV